MKILIIGGGIAGPVTAIALARAGMDVDVFEGHDGPAGHLGLFLGLAANGLRVLRQLDLLTPVLAEDIIPTPEMRFDSTTGKHLASLPAGNLAPHTPSFTIMRGALQAALAREAASRGIGIHYGKRFASCSQTSDGVVARFSDGTAARGDVLVGADGIHSAVRSYACPDAPAPSYTGLLNLGGTVRRSGVPPTPGIMRMVWGRRAFFGYTVRPDGEAWWFANLGREDEPDPGELAGIATSEWKRILTEEFREDPPELNSLIEATELIGATPIHDMPTLPRWHRGRIVVVGDAAHAVSPSAGQGASMALEDAVVLAKCLRDIDGPEAALDRFVELRRPRAERIVAMGRQRGTYKAPSNGAVRFLRDLLMPLVFRLFATERSMSWIYDHEIRWDEPVLAPSPRDRPRPARAASLVVVLLLAAGLGAAGCSSGPKAGGTEPFMTPLPSPPLLEGGLEESGRRVFELEARDGAREFLPGVRTATRGINGPHLAPTLRMSARDEVVIHLSNVLDEPTTMHWHGMELPAVIDGGPHQTIAPGSTWSPTWTTRLSGPGPCHPPPLPVPPSPG